MNKRKAGLALKLISGLILLSVLLCGITSYIGYRRFTSVLELQYNDAAYEVAETAKSYLNPDRLDEYVETGRTDEEYEEILSRLDRLVETTNVTFIYVAKVDPTDYMTLTYIYDSVNPNTGFSRYELGYTAKDIDEKYVNNVKQVMTTGERVTEYCYSYSQESGAHTTAGTAVYDSSGEIVAFLGVEKAMNSLENARKIYVMDVLKMTTLAVCAFLLLYIWYLNWDLIHPILSITAEAERFANYHVKTEGELPAGRKQDEIGTLARAVQKMEADIETYIENLTAVTAEKERIGAELSIATQIQADMLPNIFPAFPDRKEIDIYATMTPAKEVGGDFYDFFMVDDRHMAIVMADVSGKGVPAALFMVIGKTLIKDHTMPGISLGDVFTKVNQLLCESNKEGLFITAYEAVLDLVTGELVFVNAGHELPYIQRKDGEFGIYKTRAGFVLAGMEEMRYRQGTLRLEPGDRIFLYTDGVTEAANSSDELYGMRRLTEVLNRNRSKSPEELLPAIKADIDEFAGDTPQFDDITMLCLEYRSRMEE